MNNLKEFIFRCNTKLRKKFSSEYEELRKESLYKSGKWIRENREKHREMVRNYSKTENGKQAALRRNSIRSTRYKELTKNLSFSEARSIKEFYNSRPENYEVDHIIPLSKGGLNHISNLQYLSKEDNRQKYNKIAKINEQQETALNILNEKGWASISFLQMKMKVTYQESKELCLWLSTCYNVNCNKEKTLIRVNDEYE